MTPVSEKQGTKSKQKYLLCLLPSGHLSSKTGVGTVGFACGGGLGFGGSAGGMKWVSFYHMRPTSLEGQNAASAGLCLWTICLWF